MDSATQVQYSERSNGPGASPRVWIAESGTLVIDMTDFFGNVTFHLENARMRPALDVAAGSFTLGFSGTSTTGERTTNQGQCCP